MLARNKALVAVCSASLLLTGAALFAPQALAAAGFTAPEKDEDDVIKLADAPEAVRAAVAKLASADAVTKVSKDDEDGIVSYEVDYKAGGSDASVTLSMTGEILESEKALAGSDMPAAASAALKKHFASATIGSVVVSVKTVYEVQITENGKTHEVTVNAAGKIEDESNEEKGDKKDEDDKKEEKK